MDLKFQIFKLKIKLNIRFGLALKLGRLDDAKEIADESKSEEKWKQVADLAMESGSFSIAEDCMLKAKDFNGLLLYYSCIGNREKLIYLAKTAEISGYHNVAYSSYFLLNNLEKCFDILVKSHKYPEAALFCRTYYPFKLGETIDLWNREINLEDQNNRIGKIIFFNNILTINCQPSLDRV